MRDELVGKDRCVGGNLDKINGNCWDFGEKNATQRVSERQVDVGKLEVDSEVVGLTRQLARNLATMERHMKLAYIRDLYLRSVYLVEVHGIVIHGDDVSLRQ